MVRQTCLVGELAIGELDWANLDWAKDLRPLYIYSASYPGRESNPGGWDGILACSSIDHIFIKSHLKLHFIEALSHALP